MKTYNKLIEELIETSPVNSMGGNPATGQVGNAGNIAGYDPVMGMHRRKKKRRGLQDSFAGCPVFEVSSDDFTKCSHGRNKYERWGNKMNMEEADNQDIRAYAHRNPGKPIIIKDSTYGTMSYLIPRQNVNESVEHLDESRMAEINAMAREGKTHEEIGKEMNIHPSVIKKVLQGLTPAVVKGKIQGSRINKDKLGTGHVYKVDTVQGKPNRLRDHVEVEEGSFSTLFKDRKVGHEGEPRHGWTDFKLGGLNKAREKGRQAKAKEKARYDVMTPEKKAEYDEEAYREHKHKMEKMSRD